MHTAFDVLLVVATPVEMQIERLLRERGMSEASDPCPDRRPGAAPEVKAEAADVLIDNVGTIEELEDRVGEVWAGLAARAAG